MPSGPGTRVDTALEAGDRVPAEYDNLIAKVMVLAADRDAAIDRLRRALDETEVAGIQTTLPFHRFVARDPSFRSGDLSTGWVGDHWDGPAAYRRAAEAAQLAAGLQAMDAAVAAGGATTVAVSAPPHPIGALGDGRWRQSGLEEAHDRWPR
jgi:acetyl/propionyl-CoA carboxylase alpha subunit